MNRNTMEKMSMKERIQYLLDTYESTDLFAFNDSPNRNHFLEAMPSHHLCA
ncbi:hypothetical protein HYX12_02105 [Candidatus Woesearchaeota archaeon]|nr:hypothetical protein [Candidatus Woesearchaeota archaeon]